ncbi:hypothetical protein HYDPIDRAFT_89936 [Hydnomerulius pinastri MD-312]|uniref:MYND-type domain-containing protein n=1 Tax=Hydnomerulius pinastri MD-312 TaxID=994086 RepID=A0A0C9W9I1_9AGAM|nr:hypothetical protein HYDPIDRAFT_89936 [Hydnomerulius pinastri MD-312]
MSEQFTLPPRPVHLPLKTIDKCAVCGATVNLSLCSSCGERVYCSSGCQRKDWSAHKASCGKTERIDLGAFYPIFAITFDKFHAHQETGIHPALLHQIVNEPNPNAHPTQLPDGWEAKLIILGDEIRDKYNIGSAEWWPKALSDKVRSKLMRRILREGNLLVKLIAICLSILAEFYTTTSGAAKKETRFRLRQSSSPISDFGIACGPTRVTSQDKLAYYFLNEDKIIRGQDPDDHYWIYFTTARGQEFTLECGMFTFNMCYMIQTDPYLPQGAPIWSSAAMPFAPAFFRDRVLQKNTPDLHKETRRFSVLRDTSLQEAVAQIQEGFSAADLKKIYTFTGRVAKRECTAKEKKLLGVYTMLACNEISTVLESGSYKNFPASPSGAIEQDPGELDDLDTDGQLWWEHLQNWKKLKKQGKVGNQTIRQAFEEYQEQYGAAAKAKAKKAKKGGYSKP